MFRKVIRGLILGACFACANAGAADTYLSRPIRIVAPSTPGDAPDTIARLIAERLSSSLGQQVFVENHPAPEASSVPTSWPRRRPTATR